MPQEGNNINEIVLGLERIKEKPKLPSLKYQQNIVHVYCPDYRLYFAE